MNIPLASISHVLLATGWEQLADNTSLEYDPSLMLTGGGAASKFGIGVGYRFTPINGSGQITCSKESVLAVRTR